MSASVETPHVDDLRIGRIGRALRHRLGWRQRDLGRRVGLSQGEISLFERGRIDGMPIRTLRRIPEVSYAVFSERGSIDLLGWHADTATLLVVEVKSEIATVEGTFRKHDEKVRLAGRIARERLRLGCYRDGPSAGASRASQRQAPGRGQEGAVWARLPRAQRGRPTVVAIARGFDLGDLVSARYEPDSW
jgi:transcriptional regulator with XRE-family HTH domain